MVGHGAAALVHEAQELGETHERRQDVGGEEFQPELLDRS